MSDEEEEAEDIEEDLDHWATEASHLSEAPKRSPSAAPEEPDETCSEHFSEAEESEESPRHSPSQASHRAGQTGPASSSPALHRAPGSPLPDREQKRLTPREQTTREDAATDSQVLWGPDGNLREKMPRQDGGGGTQGEALQPQGSHGVKWEADGLRPRAQEGSLSSGLRAETCAAHSQLEADLQALLPSLPPLSPIFSGFGSPAVSSAAPPTVPDSEQCESSRGKQATLPGPCEEPPGSAPPGGAVPARSPLGEVPKRQTEETVSAKEARKPPSTATELLSAAQPSAEPRRPSEDKDIWSDEGQALSEALRDARKMLAALRRKAPEKAEDQMVYEAPSPGSKAGEFERTETRSDPSSSPLRASLILEKPPLLPRPAQPRSQPESGVSTASGTSGPASARFPHFVPRVVQPSTHSTAAVRSRVSRARSLDAVDRLRHLAEAQAKGEKAGNDAVAAEAHRWKAAQRVAQDKRAAREQELRDSEQRKIEEARKEAARLMAERYAGTAAMRVESERDRREVLTKGVLADLHALQSERREVGERKGLALQQRCEASDWSHAKPLIDTRRKVRLTGSARSGGSQPDTPRSGRSAGGDSCKSSARKGPNSPESSGWGAPTNGDQTPRQQLLSLRDG